MSVDIQRIKDQVLKYSDQLERVKTEVRKVLVGQDQMLERLLIALSDRRPRPARRRPRPGQDHRHQGPRGRDPLQVQAHPVHARPAAGRPDRHADLQPARRGVQHPQGPDLREPRSSPTRSTAPPPRCSRRCSRRCRSTRSRSATSRITLDEPFLVLATQNPIEQEGTYPLPEAQVDRFMLKVVVGYPSTSDERKVVDVALDGLRREVQPVLDPVTARAHEGRRPRRSISTTR